MSTNRNALGKGLGALLSNPETDVTSDSPITDTSKVVGSITTIALDKIETNPFQPRTQFEKEALSELSASIAEHGIIQPVTIRKLGFDKYQLITGERRYRAAKMAGLTEIPVYIRIANDQAMLEIALIENIQRENLDAIEIAISYKRLIDECKLTQEALSERVGKKRSTVTNYIRLLKLPPEIQLGIRSGKVSMGHARALITIENEDTQLALYEAILNENLSVRKAEELAKSNNQDSIPKITKKSNKNTSHLPSDLAKTETQLAKRYDSKVVLKRNNNGKGRIVIPFKSDEDLNRILDLLND